MGPRKKVSNACSYCKRRKLKCSTTLPCYNCRARNATCAYDQVFDGRRKESIHRAQTDSAFYKQLLKCLLERLRLGTDQRLRVLIDERASFESIAAYLMNSSPTPSSDGDSDSSPTQDSDQLEDNHHCEPGLDGLLRSVLVLSGHQKMPSSSDHVQLSRPLPSPYAVSAPGQYCQMQQHQVANLLLPPFMSQPLGLPTTQPCISNLLVSFRDACRDAISRGMPLDTVLGPKEINLDSALNGRPAVGMNTPLTWTLGLIQQYESWDVYFRLTTIYFIHQYLRWLIYPTAQNYELLPDCMRPTLYQRLIPHHTSIDICQLPAMRDVLVQLGGAYKDQDERQDIVVAQVAGLRTNWTGTWDEAVVFDPVLKHHTLSQSYLETTSKVNEWTAGRLLLTKYPVLEGQLRFAAESTIPIDDRQLHEMHELYRRR